VSILVNHPHAWILLGLLGVAAALIVWFYSRTSALVGRGLAISLTVLRSVAVALLFIVLLEPILALSRTVSERPVVAVLIDASRSMSIRDAAGGEARGREAFSLLNEVVLPRVARDADVVAYAFADDVRELRAGRASVEEPPTFDGPVTDVGQAMATLERELSDRNLAAVVLATDGAANRGASPYDAGLALGVPVFTLGVGRVEPPADIAIREAVTNRISYSGESLPVRVVVSSAGFRGAETVVEITEGGGVLDRSVIGLSGSGEEVEITFRVTPSTEGVHRYTVSVPEAPGELTTANNTRVVATTTLKGKIRALVVAPRPSWEFAFVARELRSDSSVDVDAVAFLEGAPAAGEPAMPGSREELYRYDLVVLVEPERSPEGLRPEWLSGFVEERGGGLLLLGSPGAVGRGELDALSPVVIRDGVSLRLGELRVSLTGDGESAPTTRLVSDRYENLEIWRSLPPVWASTRGAWAARPDARVLVAAEGTEDAEVPVIITRRLGGGSVMAIAASGIWRWKMAGPSEVDVYDLLIANAARWLTARGELSRVAVTTDKDVYAAGEPVRFSAQVYGQDYRLSRDASVTVEAARGEGAAPVGSVALAPEGDFYRGELPAPAPGRYTYRADGTVRGEEVGSAEGEFTVEEFSLEDSEVRRRAALLTRLSEETGGGYYSPETVGEMPGEVELEWTRGIVAREFELWNSPWLLVGFVGLVSLEWALRRRKGLP
jgi:hypothetical protein